VQRLETSEKADHLRRLHQHRPLVLPNAWDAASARTFAAAGFPAVATSSAAVAAVLGYEDHEGAPADEVFDAVARITRAVDVPVTADIEAGYGLAAAEVVDRLLEAGAVGCNLEDTDHSTGEQRPLDAQTERLGAVAEAAAGRIVLNARVDTYLRGHPDDEAAIARARAYLGAGADCAYPIGYLDEATVGRLIAAVDGPLNILAWKDGPAVSRLGELGVARVTFGGGLFREVQEGLTARAAELLP
jgi:2-methylisocitrate lyase-like PEP mutase family enzyme